MRYCLWKSIGNHHIPTTDKLHFKFVLNKTTKCNYAKNVGAPCYNASCLQYRTILINRVVISGIENKSLRNLFFFKHISLSFEEFYIDLHTTKSDLYDNRKR